MRMCKLTLRGSLTGGPLKVPVNQWHVRAHELAAARGLVWTDQLREVHDAPQGLDNIFVSKHIVQYYYVYVFIISIIVLTISIIIIIIICVITIITTIIISSITIIFIIWQYVHLPLQKRSATRL